MVPMLSVGLRSLSLPTEALVSVGRVARQIGRGGRHRLCTPAVEEVRVRHALGWEVIVVPAKTRRISISPPQTGKPRIKNSACRHMDSPLPPRAPHLHATLPPLLPPPAVLPSKSLFSASALSPIAAGILRVFHRIWKKSTPAPDAASISASMVAWLKTPSDLRSVAGKKVELEARHDSQGRSRAFNLL